MDAIEKQFIEMYKNFGRVQGIDELTVEIFARLYISPDEIAMEEIAKDTGYSLASISNKIKMLEQVGWVIKLRKPGSKKVFLKVEKSIGGLMKEGILAKEKAIMNTIGKEMPPMIEEGKKKAKTDIQKKKIKILEKYYKETMMMKKHMKDMFIKINDELEENGKE